MMYGQNEMEYYNQYSQQSIDNYAETQNPSKGKKKSIIIISSAIIVVILMLAVLFNTRSTDSDNKEKKEKLTTEITTELSLETTTGITTEELIESEDEVVETTAEPYVDYYGEAQAKREEGLLEEAETSYENAYVINGEEQALIDVINMWISEGNDEKVKEWVQFCKDNCKEPSEELNSVITRGEKCQWMIVSVRGEGFDESTSESISVEYDNEGRIIRSNIDFHDNGRFGYMSWSYYYYEYLEDGRVKVSNGENDDRPYYYTFDEEDGRILYMEFTDSENRKHESYYQYIDEYTQAYGEGISYNGKVEISNYIAGEKSFGNYYYINFTGKKIGVFPVTGNHQDSADVSVVNNFDEYGNLIYRMRYFKNMYGDTKVGEFYFEYAYCTPEEYFTAKENNDFSEYKISNLDTHVGNEILDNNVEY